MPQHVEIPKRFYPGWKRCIFCFESKPLTHEHFFPQCIGGFFAIKFACKECNSEFGSELDHLFKRDPQFRLAFEPLKADIPELYDVYSRRNLFVGQDDEGYSVKLAKTSIGVLRVLSEQRVDGSLIIDTRDVSKRIERVLRSLGKPESEIAARIGEFRNFPELAPWDFPELHSMFIKKPLKSVAPKLQPTFVPDRLILKLAYEVICLIVDPLKHLKYCRPIVAGIREDTMPVFAAIERGLADGKPRPYHRLMIRAQEKSLEITFYFLDIILYRIILTAVSIRLPEPVRIVFDLRAQNIFRA